ncbi:MAG: indole-3-glycerol phosphate synthase TrpC [Chloroflexia bacterium]
MPEHTILNTIIEHKRAEVAAHKAARVGSPAAAERTGPEAVRDFRAALGNPARPAPRVIAEIKRRSPSKGVLRAGLDPATIAAIYEQNGAAAISVLTDSHFFGGSYHDLAAARGAVSLPVLCKDFIVEPYQVVEAFQAGADALLLIAAVLDNSTLRDCRQIASTLGMAALVEVHNEAELRSALDAGAEIVGINNRDLRTFQVDLGTTAALAPLVPHDVLLVSESGIRDASDRERLRDLGAAAILVGESLITAPDTAAATRAMCSLEPVMPRAIGEVSLT